MDLKEQIKEHGEALRKLKANNPQWHTDKNILEHIWNLLNLKSRDPSLNEEVFGTEKVKKKKKIQNLNSENILINLKPFNIMKVIYNIIKNGYN